MSQDAGLVREASFWPAYLEAAKPEGAASFGRHLGASRDALFGGGPGNAPSDQSVSIKSYLSTMADIVPP